MSIRHQCVPTDGNDDIDACDETDGKPVQILDIQENKIADMPDGLFDENTQVDQH